METKIKTVSIRLLGKLYEIEKNGFEQEAFTKQQLAYLLSDHNAIRLGARVNGEIAGFAIAQVDIGRNAPFGHILIVDITPFLRLSNFSWFVASSIILYLSFVCCCLFGIVFYQIRKLE